MEEYLKDEMGKEGKEKDGSEEIVLKSVKIGEAKRDLQIRVPTNPHNNPEVYSRYLGELTYLESP